jgi:hypothetical protein
MTWKSVVFFVYTDVTNKEIYAVVKNPTITEAVRLNIRRAQVKVGLINLCKGLFRLNARIIN